MSTHLTSWFHCGRCGSLFQAPIGTKEARTCSVCGGNPSLGVPPPVKTPPAVPASAPREEQKTRPVERKRVKSRKSKVPKVMARIVIGGILFFSGIVFIGGHIWKEKPQAPSASKHGEAESTISAEDSVLLQKAVPLCSKSLNGYLAAGTPEGRNEFVANPVETASRMYRYESTRSLATINTQNLSYKGSGVVRLPDRTLVETQWAQADGKTFDAVFVEENGDWRLDWDHFVRYGDQSWDSFASGEGASEGEFRVLAREPLADERKGAPTISIVLYEPRAGDAQAIGRQSPEIAVKRDSEDGKLLAEAFRLEKSNQRPLGSSLARIDPKDLVRLRLKVRREKSVDGHAFTIMKVVAINWY